MSGATTTLLAQSLAAPDRGTWRAAVRKYQAIARINAKSTLAYTWDAMSGGFFALLFIFVFAQLWTTTFAIQDAHVIAGLTLNQTIWYYVWAELVTLSKINPVLKIQEEVKDGSLAYTLGRPYNYVLYHFFSGLGLVLIRLTVTLVFGSLVAVAVTGPLDTFRPATLPGLLLITALAFILDYCIVAAIGLTAFVVEDTTAFRLIYSKITFVLGGLLIPVDFLPEGIQGAARILPFNLVVYAPAKLFVAWDRTQFWQILGLQLAWIGIMGTALFLLFRWGARRVSINGG